MNICRLFTGRRKSHGDGGGRDDEPSQPPDSPRLRRPRRSTGSDIDTEDISIATGLTEDEIRDLFD
ncbi:MAG: hypothetical protein LBQ56_06120 [Synergistaceae bacterium]|nr:hypothetical protein [Synergistaceae bacterium]